MNDRVLETAQAAFTDFVETLFADATPLPDGSFEVPLIGGRYSHQASAKEIAALKQRVAAALAARRSFADEAPRSWGAPLLPLTIDDCQPLFRTNDRRLELTAAYALDQIAQGWRPEPFFDWCMKRVAASAAHG